MLKYYDEFKMYCCGKKSITSGKRKSKKTFNITFHEIEIIFNFLGGDGIFPLHTRSFWVYIGSNVTDRL